MISRIAPTLLFVLATMVSAKELAVVQKDFQRTVRPVLQKFCFDCHGENKSKAGIRVDYLDGTVPDKEVRHWEIIRAVAGGGNAAGRRRAAEQGGAGGVGGVD